MKKSTILILVGLICASSYVYFTYIHQKARILPLTYQIKTPKPAKNDLKSASILILGDHTIKRFTQKFLPDVIQKLSTNLQKPIEITDLTSDNEGLHRSVHKVIQLGELPNIVVYMAGNSDFLERKFNVRDYKNIMENLSIYRNEKKSSLIMAIPWLSKFIYRPTSHFTLQAQIKSDNSKYSGKAKMHQMELMYNFYQLELEELIKKVREQGKNLVLVTAPINLTLAPKKICQNTTTETFNAKLDQLEEIVAQGKGKTILNELEKYSQATLGNAKVFYLLGHSHLSLGNYSRAREYFNKAVAFDCESWRPNSVFNAIIRKEAKKFDLFLIDFDEIVNSQLGRNDLFIDELTPHDIYFRDLVQELVNTVKSIFNI